MPDAGTRRAGRGDLTQGPIAKTLLAFALPTLASSILQSLNGTVNAIWVGRFLGEGALAATSNANMVMFLLTAFVFGFGMASTILIGQAWEVHVLTYAPGRPPDQRPRRLRTSSDTSCTLFSSALSPVAWRFLCC